ncbi:MAG: Endonuclease/exonuclease/phosphatase [Acidimicrobiales bacterium]|nr:Endonuclease/exonuclease/phosphatase [Acidimicrobiales bacterium]
MDPDRPLRLLFWNAWLLHPRLWSSGPRLPDVGGHFSPAIERRARLAGEVVVGRADVTAFAECWEASDAAAVAAAWADRPGVTVVAGPARGRRHLTGSGLLTVVDGLPVVRRAKVTYQAVGDWWRDADALASKGASLVEVVAGPGRPRVEVCSTHLLAGGGSLVPAPGHDDQRRHHAVRMAQVDELVAFLQREHDPANALVLVGDLNVAAVDPVDAVDPTAGYRELVERLGPLGLVDAWPQHGVGPGGTCDFSPIADLPLAADGSGAVVDLLDEASRFPKAQRIDYALIATPAERPASVGVGAIRRWCFQGDDGRDPQGCLSDHLALSVDLTFA